MLAVYNLSKYRISHTHSPLDLLLALIGINNNDFVALSTYGHVCHSLVLDLGLGKNVSPVDQAMT